MSKPRFLAAAAGLPTLSRRQVLGGILASAIVAAAPGAAAAPSIHPDDVRLFTRLLQHIEESPNGFVAAFDGRNDHL